MKGVTPNVLGSSKGSDLKHAAIATAAVTVAATVPLVDMKDQIKSRWHTKKLGLRLGADAVSAASAAVLVAPVISIIDR